MTSRPPCPVGVACAMAVALAAAGCSDPSAARVDRYTVGDTLVVENLRPIVADTLVPVEVQRYGRVDGATEYLLAGISAFTVAGDGSVALFDAAGIRRFDAEGVFLDSVARRGQGPAEVQSVVGMDAAADGRLAVADAGNRRLTVFRPDRPPESIVLPDGRPSYRDGSVVFGDDGRLWLSTNPPPPDGGLGHPRPIYLQVSDGEFVDTLSTPAWIAHHCPARITRQSRRGFFNDGREPFEPRVKWALGADGTVAVGCSASYRFYVLSPGRPPLRIARARERARVSDEERAFREAMPVPKAEGALPAYARILLPGDGRVWVWPTQPNTRVALDSETAREFNVSHTWLLPWQGAFDVFTPDGEWLGVVALPERARYSGFPTEPGVVIRGDTIWAVEQDDLEVETVVRYLVPGLSDSTRR